MTKTWFLFISLFLASCRSSDSELLQLVTVEATVKPHEDIMILCPWDMQFSDGKLIVLNDCGNHPVYILDPATGEEHWVGRFGDGPNEIGAISLMRSHKIESGTLLRLLDSRKRKFFRLVNTEDGYTLQEDREIPAMLFTWHNFTELTDGSIVYNQLSGPYNMSRWLPNGEELFVMDFQPDVGSPNQGMDKAYEYYNNLVVHPSGEKIIQVLQHFPYMLAYNQQLERVEIKQTRDNVPKPDWSIDGDKKFNELPRYALHALSGQDYFYVVNPRTTYEETFNEVYKPSIDIYTWDMELVASLSLDKRLLTLAIDFENKKIYGITFGSDDMVLGEVSIPTSLHQFF